MNSLDDVYDQMRLFQRALLEFNEEIRTSAQALAKSHDDLCGLWRDQAALHYRQLYEPLADSLHQYLQGDAPRFERFMENKVRQLERYLNGA